MKKCSMTLGRFPLPREAMVKLDEIRHRLTSGTQHHGFSIGPYGGSIREDARVIDATLVEAGIEPAQETSP